MRPMLAVRGDRLPDGPGWCHEVKWDGVRVLVSWGPSGIRVQTRNGNDVTAAFPEYAGLQVDSGGRRVGSVLLDGEMVAMVEGRPSFGAVATRIRGRARRAAPLDLVLVLFDVVERDGRDLSGWELQHRRVVLDDLTFSGSVGAVMRSPVHDDARALWEATAAQGLEGIVSKRWDSRYEPGVHSRSWLKFPHRTRSSWVVGGWRPEVGGQRLGALVLGEPALDAAGALVLRARGAVGSGITAQQAAGLRDELAAQPRESSPFIDLDRAEERTARWTEPRLVVEVESLGLTDSGRVRQARFVGVRPDVTPHDLLDAEEVENSGA